MSWHARKQDSVALLPPVLAEWNDDADGGAWTGYDALIAAMHHGEVDVEGPGVEARTPEQRAALRHLRNTARRLGYQPGRTERHGLACLWYRFERQR